MSKNSFRILLAATIFVAVNSFASGQAPATPAPAQVNTAAASQPVAITAATSPEDLAHAALAALGGPNYLNLKSLVLTGTADLYAPTSTQSVPSKFVIVESAGRYRIEIQSPLFTFRQIANGEESYTSIQGINLPNPNRFGLAVLRNVNTKGFAISALPDKKKLRAFRITSPNGDATDYFIDPQNGWIMSFESTFEGHHFGVDNKTYKLVDGILVPYSFSQRFAGPQGEFIGEFKVKEVKVNQPIDDDVFQIPQQ